MDVGRELQWTPIVLYGTEPVWLDENYSGPVLLD